MKITFTLLLSLALFTNGHSQQYLNNTSEWYFAGNSFDMLFTSYIYHRYYYFEGDSTIDGHLYYKVYRDRYDTLYNYSTDEVTPDVTIHEQIGFLREENGAFYKRSMDAPGDTLTFDFNEYQLGDTVGYGSIYCPEYHIVTSIDTVYLGTEPRRRYFINDINMHFVVEGVGGGSMGFELGCPGQIFFEGSVYPMCYSMNGYSIPIGFGTAECESGIGNGIVSAPDLEQVGTFPNPVDDVCMVTGLPPGAQVTVFDGMGRTCGIRLESDRLDFSGEAAGIYFVQVKAGHHVITRKVVRQ